MAKYFMRLVGSFILLLSCSGLKAQLDSTDLNFYAEPFVPLTLEDTMAYGVSGHDQLKLEFDLEDTLLNQFRIEVVTFDFEGNQFSAGAMQFSRSQLEEQDLIAGNHVTLNAAVVVTGLLHQVFFIVLDEHGHENRSITKYLAE